MTDRLRLRISPCPNDTFMFEALLNGRIPTQGLAFEVGFQDIEELNEGVSSPDGPDISKISYAVLPAVVDRYALLDSGSALGRGNGQLLPRRPVADPARSHSGRTHDGQCHAAALFSLDRRPYAGALFRDRRSGRTRCVRRGRTHSRRAFYLRAAQSGTGGRSGSVVGAADGAPHDRPCRWAASWRVGNCRRRCVAPSIGYCTTASPTRSNTRRFRGRSSGNTLVSWTTR